MIRKTSKITINLVGTKNESLGAALDLAYSTAQSLNVQVNLEYFDRIYEITPDMHRNLIESLKNPPLPYWQFDNKQREY